jgi:hypothetical protein
MSGKGILLVFFVCALADFVIGYFNGRSIGYGIGRAIVGLGGTAILLWLFGLFGSSNTRDKSDATDDPNEPARWVP